MAVENKTQFKLKVRIMFLGLFVWIIGIILLAVGVYSLSHGFSSGSLNGNWYSNGGLTASWYVGSGFVSGSIGIALGFAFLILGTALSVVYLKDYIQNRFE